MLTNCFRFAPRDSVPGLISKICKYLKDHPGWSVEELKDVIGDIETSLAIGNISYFTEQSINDLDARALYDVGYRFVFIGGVDVYSAMYALEESDGGVIANGVSLGVTESEFNQLKSIVLALNNAAYTATNPPPYPVTKVNNRTGDVKLDLHDVLGESTAQTMLMSEINFASTQLATWNAFYDYGYRVVGVLANDGSAITALYILGQNVGNHAPIPMSLSTGGNVISVNGDIGEVFTLRVDPKDPGIPTDPPVPINATTLNGKSADYYATTAQIGDSWAAGKNYAAGDYAINENTLYKCKTAHTAGNTFEAAYWKAVSLSEELNAVNKKLFVKQKTTGPDGIVSITLKTTISKRVLFFFGVANNFPCTGVVYARYEYDRSSYAMLRQFNYLEGEDELTILECSVDGDVVTIKMPIYGVYNFMATYEIE